MNQQNRNTGSVSVLLPERRFAPARVGEDEAGLISWPRLLLLHFSSVSSITLLTSSRV